MVAPPEHPSLADLRRELASGDLILFVGAGPSMAAGLPSWGRLVDGLAERAQAMGIDPLLLEEIADLCSKGQLLDALSAAKQALGSVEFGNAVEQALQTPATITKAADLPEIFTVLNDLAERAFLLATTNLDTLLEIATQGRLAVLSRPTADAARRRHTLLKMHGTLPDRASWVLTRDQYEGAIYADRSRQETFAALVRSRPLLFIGYGLSDGDLDLILASIRATAEDSAPHSYAFLSEESVTPYRRGQLQKGGVRIIPYPNAGGKGKHEALVSALRSLLTTSAPSMPEPPGTSDKTPRIHISPETSEKLSAASSDVVKAAREGWPYELLAQVLDDDIRLSGDLRRDWRVGVSVGRPHAATGTELGPIVSAEVRALLELMESYSKVITDTIPGGLAKATSADDIVYIGRKLSSLHRETLEWSIAWRRYTVDPQFKSLLKLLEDSSREFILLLEGIPGTLRAAVDDALARRAAGLDPPLGISLVVTSKVASLLNAEIERLIKVGAFGTPSAPMDSAVLALRGEFTRVVRRVKIAWAAEKSADPMNLDDARNLVARLRSDLEEIYSDESFERSGIDYTNLFHIVTRLRELEEHQLHLDGGISRAAFWQEGDSIIEASLVKMIG